MRPLPKGSISVSDGALLHFRSHPCRVFSDSIVVSITCDHHSCAFGFPSDLGSTAINEKFDTGDETGVIRSQKDVTFATSSCSPMRPIGIVDTIRVTSGDCRRLARQLERVLRLLHEL